MNLYICISKTNINQIQLWIHVWTCLGKKRHLRKVADFWNISLESFCKIQIHKNDQKTKKNLEKRSPPKSFSQSLLVKKTNVKKVDKCCPGFKKRNFCFR